MDLLATEALLNLHCSPTRRSPSDFKLEIQGAAPLFLSRQLTPETSSTSAQPSPSMSKSLRHGSVSSASSQEDKSEANSSSQSSFDGLAACTANLYHKSTDINRYLELDYTIRYTRQVKQDPKMKASRRSPIKDYDFINRPIYSGQIITRVQGTQTDNVEFHQNTASSEVENMAAIISKLYGEISSLENELRARQRNIRSPTVSGLHPDISTNIKIQQYEYYNNQNNNRTETHTRSDPNSNDAQANSTDIDMNASDYECKPEYFTPSEQIVDGMTNPKSPVMVYIGEGHASVPVSLLKQIDWSSYKIATKELLTAVFSKRVLATHSLTGKPSPAFPGIPAKKQLDPKLVEDIVQTIVELCGVPARFVRPIITMKCAVERNRYARLEKYKNRKHQLFTMDQENISPLPYAVGESSDIALPSNL